MGIGKRIKEAREQANLTQEELANLIGVTSSAITNYEKETSHPKEPILYALIDALNVSPNYLFQDCVSTINKSPVLSSEALKIARSYEALDAFGKRAVSLIIEAEADRMSAELPASAPAPRFIHHYLTPAAAGYAAPIEGEDYELVPRGADVPTGADFCIDISGDSMEPYIKDGSRVYVQRGDVEEMRDAGVFYVDGDVFVKQWCVDMIGTLHLLSANPKREDANIQIFKDSGRNVVCFGKVLLPKKLPQPVYRR